MGEGDIYTGLAVKNIFTITDNSITLKPNVYTIIMDTAVTSLSIDLESSNNIVITKAPEYILQITPQTDDVSLSFSASIIWANNKAPVLQAFHRYVISIVNNTGVWIECY